MSPEAAAFTAGTLLTTLWRRKVNLIPDNGDLIVSPASELTISVKLALIEHKAVILDALLRAGPEREIKLHHLVAAQRALDRWK